MDLQPHQFFHGTRAPLSEGATLLPYNHLSSRKPNYPAFADHSRNKVFMAHRDENNAWQWAGMAGMPDMPGEGKRSSVLAVEPDRSDLRIGPAETTAPSAKVVERLDIMPGRQGTLPVNWNQFAKGKPPLDRDSYNHPDDIEIAEGHRIPDRLPGPDESLETLTGKRKPDPNEGQGRLF